MAIVFFISGHGFGHASRDAEVINHLPALRRPLIIRSSVSPSLLARTLRVPYELRPGPCDTGIVQTTSIVQNDAATVREAAVFYRDFDARASAEADALGGVGAQLVVGDIPPLAFAVAARLGVPAVALGNFTWDWIYAAHPGFADGAPGVIDTIRSAYRHATRALELPFSGGFEAFQRVERVPLIARRPTQSRAATRAHFGLPANGRVALLSFGGYGLPSLDLTHVDIARDWTIVTTDRVSEEAARSSSVRVIAEHAFLSGPPRYEDLIAASDVVVSKPGYGIISDCVASETALLYTSRGEFREYDVLVREMPRAIRCRFISHTDLFAGRWRDAIGGLLAQPPAPEHLATNGAEVAAEIIAGI